jgi:hypothetical protein
VTAFIAPAPWRRLILVGHGPRGGSCRSGGWVARLNPMIPLAIRKAFGRLESD